MFGLTGARLFGKGRLFERGRLFKEIRYSPIYPGGIFGHVMRLFCCKARRKRLEHERRIGRKTHSHLLVLTSWVLMPLPKCFTTVQSAVKASLFFYNKESVEFPTRYFQFLKQILFPKRTTVSSACSTLMKHATISRLESLLAWFK